MPRIVVTAKVKPDIERIASYIARDHLRAAIGFILATKDAFVRLAEFPGIGPEWEPVIKKYPGLRFWPIKRYSNYLILYRPVQDGVEILRVIHGARDINRVLDPRQ